MKKKILSLLLMAAMIFSMFPASSFAVAVDNSYIPGTYTGEADGYKGKVNVNVTLEEADGNIVISEITAQSEKETESYWNTALTVLDSIKSKNGTTGVDTVSSATYSSKAIIEATDNALSKATSALSGSGTQADPYIIMNKGQLAGFATSVDDGKSYEGKFVVLGADIDLSDIDSWNPIGDESGTSNIFNGTFDGKGYTISNMTIKESVTAGVSNHGLFSTLGNKAVVKNLNVTKANVSVENSNEKVRAGVIAGGTEKVASASHSNIGTRIDSCSASGTVAAVSTGDRLTYAGGIAGTGEVGTAITNCWTDVAVSAVVNPASNKNSMAGGIIGNSGNYVVIANCATFGNVYAASPAATNYGGMAGGIVGMMAGKQYNVYAKGDMTVGNGGTAHTWIGALDGQVTSSGMSKDNNYTVYPNQGELRFGGYYAGDISLKVEVYEANGTKLKEMQSITPVVDRGYSSKLPSLDKAMISTEMTKAEMSTETFADTLNGNIKKANQLLEAYGIEGISLREWKLSDGRVLPVGDVWVNGEIDSSIFSSGEGTEESPYIISNEKQLRDFAASLNEKIDYTGKVVALGDNIELSSETWKPVGGSDYLFNGTFDGKGYTVSGMTIGSAENPYALDKENLYIGFFGVLGPDSKVKNLNLDELSFYTTYEATAYVGGIAGVTQGSTSKNNYTGPVIDGCSVKGNLSLKGTKGNQFVGGIIGMQYKGAVINCSTEVNASGVVLAGDLAEVGGLVGLNNRGLVANSYSKSNIYGSGNRENGNEGMAVVSNLVACNAGMLVNCYGSGDVTTKEHSTYAGMVSGWVTGIGKTYSCWYDLDSKMIVGEETDNPLTVNPVESIGTKVASGVNDEGDAYTGGLVDKMSGYNKAGYQAIAQELNNTFEAFPADITIYGLDDTALKQWMYTSETVTFASDNAKAVYVQPECEKIEKPEQKLNDGTWYGRDDDKKSVVKITVNDGAITDTETVSGESSGESYDAAVEKAKYKATYGDFSHYEEADAGKFDGGKGTAEDPYRISNEEQLRYLSYSINEDTDWSGKYFVQTANINLTKEWQPIGWALNGEVNGQKTPIGSYPFRGNYNGGDYTISGLAIGTAAEPADQMTSGLFGLTSGTVTTNDKISETDNMIRLENIHLEGIKINVATRYETFTGGLVGSGQYGIFIDNCSVTGSINVTTSESFARAGGIAASALRGTVTNSWADVNINAATDTNNVYAGGFYGMDNRVTTINCYSLGSVTGNSTNNNKVHIGGFAGQAGGIHVNCYAVGDVVSLKTTTDVGIFSGRSAGIAIDYNCYYNSDAYLKQGDTVVTPAKGIGVIATNAAEPKMESKTESQLKGNEFAQMLNSNLADKTLEKAFAEIDEILVSQAGRDFVQQNYYQGNQLKGWACKNGTVTFEDKQSQPSVPATPSAADDDVKTDTDSTTSNTTTSTTIRDTKTETVKDDNGNDISKITATVSDKVADKLVDQAVSNKSDTVEITVKSDNGNKVDSEKQIELEIPKSAVKDIADKTDASLVINTDNGQVVLDNKTLETIASETEGDTVRIAVNENTQLKESQKPAADVIGDNGYIFDLRAYIGDKLLHDFKGGKAHVTLPMPEKLDGRDVAVIYINDKGICEILNHTVKTVGADKYIRFTTPHFSTYAIVESADAEKLIKQQNEDKASTLIKEAKLAVSTAKTSKKNVKVTVKTDKSLIKELKSMGYTVKYKYYRSTKKASKYTAVKTKTGNTYINTTGKKGTKYYYKAKVLVYDGKELIAQTALKQCSYGVRTWSK